MEATQFTTPFIWREGLAPVRLQRVSFDSTGTTGFKEDWLQQRLYEHPELLPCEEIDPAFRTLVPVCRELNTHAGPVDLLYVTPWGDLAVVETKLWRNPEARRVVVAQVMDYAKELVKWSYSDLEAQVRVANKGLSSLYDCVRNREGALLEPEFHDRVQRVLQSGQFLLLIVGDGIREGVTALADFLDRFGTMQFSFGLIEAAVYEMPGIGKLIQPRILAKTVIIKRSVVILSESGSSRTAVVKSDDEVADADADADAELRARNLADFYREFWTRLLAGLKLSDSSQTMAKPSSSTNIYFPMPPSGAVAWVSAYFAQSKRQVGVYLTFTRGALARTAWDDLYAQREEIERETGLNINWDDDGTGKYSIIVRMQYDSLQDPATLDQIAAFFRTRIDAFVTAFRPRLQRIIESLDKA